MNAAKETFAAKLERVFAAPRERVFEAWTDPKQIQRWWAPGSLEITEVEGEVAPGSALRVVMLNHDNDERYVSDTTYLEVDRPNRIVWTVKFDWAPDENTRVTVTFEDTDGGTRVTLLHEWFTDDDTRAGVQMGWTDSLDELAALLAEGA